MFRISLYVAVVLIFFGLILFVVGLFHPVLFIEDGLIETAGAALFFAAAVVSLYCLIAGRNTCSRLETVVTVLLVPASLVLALSEISFGARLGLLSPPAMYGGGEFDGGHDALILILRLIRDGQLSGWFYLIVAFISVTAGWAAYRWRHLGLRLWSDVKSNPLLLGVAASASLVALAVILDLKTQRHLSLVEETLEFLSAAVLVATVSYRSLVFKREAWQAKLRDVPGRSI